MSLNLKKHETEILNAWKKVTENEESYDWALFGYEGKTFALKVVSLKIKVKKFLKFSLIKFRKQLEVVELKLLQRNLMMERSNMDLLEFLTPIHI